MYPVCFSCKQAPVSHSQGIDCLHRLSRLSRRQRSGVMGRVMILYDWSGFHLCVASVSWEDEWALQTGCGHNVGCIQVSLPV